MEHAINKIALVLSLLLAMTAPIAAERPDALQPFTTDGCSLFPDRSPSGKSDWCGCCVAHDLVYWRGGTSEARLKADHDLLACVRRQTGSDALADVMFAGVRSGGGPYFKTPYRWGYGWPYGRGYDPLSSAEQAQADKLEKAYRAQNPALSCPAADDSRGTASPATRMKDQVIATERAFAKTMADRDLAAFGRFISEEAVFFSGNTPLRGKARVIEAWTRFFNGPTPPFSWEPKDVEVLESGQLALSSGPVHDAKGQLIATFMSIWRLEAPGTWRIVFDKGSETRP